PGPRQTGYRCGVRAIESLSRPPPPISPTSTMQNEPNTPQNPFQVSVAERVRRLPPYLFGKINALKYAKRRAGIDVIDLGMGNPTDVPNDTIIEKLREAVTDD